MSYQYFIDKLVGNNLALVISFFSLILICVIDNYSKVSRHKMFNLLGRNLVIGLIGKHL